MTPEAQRVAIAEACGWKNVRAMIVKNVSFDGDDRHCGVTSEDGWVPDYLNDLNAMHEAEKVLSNFRRKEYTEWLDAILNSEEDFDIVHATAAQRAEAFLKTLGLWVEEVKVDMKVA